MTKTTKTGAAPVSKYAAKKAARIEANINEQNETVNDANLPDEVLKEDITEQNSNEQNVHNRFNRDKKKNGLPPIVSAFPEHIVQIALLLKNNAEIRRFTALGILNYLLQKNEINGEKRYVSFKWNKFAVKANGLMREYSYNEPFFLNALVAAFSSFSASAQRTIDNFCKKEMSIGIGKAIDPAEVENITALNEQYEGNTEHVVEE